MEGLASLRTLKLLKACSKKVATVIQPLAIQGATRADKIPGKLFAVAEGGGDLCVTDVWGKLSTADKAELGDAHVEQLLALETAAREYRATDPDAVVDSPNASIA